MYSGNYPRTFVTPKNAQNSETKHQSGAVPIPLLALLASTTSTYSSLGVQNIRRPQGRMKCRNQASIRGLPIPLLALSALTTSAYSSLGVSQELNPHLSYLRRWSNHSATSAVKERSTRFNGRELYVQPSKQSMSL